MPDWWTPDNPLVRIVEGSISDLIGGLLLLALLAMGGRSAQLLRAYRQARREQRQQKQEVLSGLNPRTQAILKDMWLTTRAAGLSGIVLLLSAPILYFFNDDGRWLAIAFD